MTIIFTRDWWVWWNRSGSTLAQVMACYLMAPGHYLNWCWLLIDEDLWRSPESSSDCPSYYPVYVMSLKIILLKLPSHLPGANDLCPANERGRYKVTLSVIGWAQTYLWVQAYSAEWLWCHLVVGLFGSCFLYHQEKGQLEGDKKH